MVSGITEVRFTGSTPLSAQPRQRDLPSSDFRVSASGSSLPQTDDRTVWSGCLPRRNGSPCAAAIRSDDRSRGTCTLRPAWLGSRIYSVRLILDSLLSFRRLSRHSLERGFADGAVCHRVLSVDGRLKRILSPIGTAEQIPRSVRATSHCEPHRHCCTETSRPNS